jgi:PAP2 superfamily protein
MPLSREDRWLTLLLLLPLSLAFVSYGINAQLFHFTGISYFPCLLTPVIFLALILAYRDRSYASLSPRARFIVKNCAFYALAHFALALFVTGLQFTPFPPIDLTLQRWDRFFNFDTAAALSWTASHPALRALLILCYASTDFQLALAPLVAGFAFDRRRMSVYLYAFIYSFLVGGLFYYFFPSSGPGSIYHSPYFMSSQLLTSAKFYEVHHFQKVTSIQGGMIAFPSFHVMWAVLTSYAALPNRRLFWGVAALNILVVASTVLLGWHYLVDVPAGLFLGALGLWAGAFTRDRVSQTTGTFPGASP